MKRLGSGYVGASKNDPIAVGGQIFEDDLFVYHAFFESGTFESKVPRLEADILLVAGGGGGGTMATTGAAGGGGAGTVIVFEERVITQEPITALVGAGGAPGSPGEDSMFFGGGQPSFFSIPGGGAGGSTLTTTTSISPTAGGSGGGGISTGSSVLNRQGATAPAPYSDDPGYYNEYQMSGGGGFLISSPNFSFCAGGGGGAGAVGASGIFSGAGNGGAGVDLTQWASALNLGTVLNGVRYLAGGGGGGLRVSGTETRTTSSGGVGGGGAGVRIASTAPTDATSGQQNTGSGGGGGGGAGGSGLIVIRYRKKTNRLVGFIVSNSTNSLAISSNTFKTATKVSGTPTSSSLSGYNSMVGVPGMYLAQFQSNVFHYSSNLLDWSTITLNEPLNSVSHFLHYGNGTFLIIPSGSGISGRRSVDGINWTTISLPANPSEPEHTNSYHASLGSIHVLMPIGAMESSVTKYRYSTDNGSTWSLGTLPLALTSSSMVIQRIIAAKFNGQPAFILTYAPSATYYVSTDGIAWTSYGITTVAPNVCYSPKHERLVFFGEYLDFQPGSQRYYYSSALSSSNSYTLSTKGFGSVSSATLLPKQVDGLFIVTAPNYSTNSYKVWYSEDGIGWKYYVDTDSSVVSDSLRGNAFGPQNFITN